MSGVTIIPHGAETAPDGDAPDSLIGDGGFYPALSLSEFRENFRVPSTMTDGRVKQALRDASLKTRHDLKAYREDKSDYAALDDIPSEMFDGVSVLSLAYESAVFNEAKACLTESYRDFDSTQSGHDEADKLEMGIEDYRRVARENIRRLLGIPRATIRIL